MRSPLAGLALLLVAILALPHEVWGGAAFTRSLPLPDGRSVEFRAVEASIFGPEFQAEHPELRTYRAEATGDAGMTARLDVTPGGVHAIVFTPEGTALVAPGPGRADRLKSTWLRDAASSEFECEVLDDARAAARKTGAVTQASGDQRRTFRFILMATGEYSQALGGTSQALSQMTTSMNRIIAILERDVAVRFTVVQMVAYADPAIDPYPDISVGSLLTRNAVVVDSLFGHAAWDMTQAIAVSASYRGVSFRPLLCEPGFGERSAVAGPDPTAAQFDIKVMAHEIGHTLGATHTQDGGSNRSAETPFEPGTGWTILTSPGDPASFGDAYYHVASLAQIDTVLLAPGAPDICGVFDATGNTPPTVDAGPDYAIPTGTPFVLTGSGSDPDAAAALVYTWEEYDRAPAVNDPVNGPLFRWRPPTSAPVRFCPAAATVLAGSSDPLEKLPLVARTLHFRLVARDQQPGAGGHAWDEMTITVSGAPFVVTAPNGGETLAAGTPFNVTWNAGGGSIAPAVDILLSTDGGAHWTPLALATPNDGAEPVTAVLGDTKTTCRIQVRASGNIFYDVSNANFTIVGDPTETSLSMLRAEATDEGVALEWRLGARFVTVTVERAERGGAWIEPAGETRAGSETTTFFDRSVAPGADYEYRLRAADAGGTVTWFGPVAVRAMTAVDGLAIVRLSPNPARDRLAIDYQVPRTAYTRLRILDVQGRVVATLVDGTERAGRAQAFWTLDRQPGVYFVSLAQGGRVAVRRVTAAR